MAVVESGIGHKGEVSQADLDWLNDLRSTEAPNDNYRGHRNYVVLSDIRETTVPTAPTFHEQVEAAAGIIKTDGNLAQKLLGRVAAAVARKAPAFSHVPRGDVDDISHDVWMMAMRNDQSQFRPEQLAGFEGFYEQRSSRTGNMALRVLRRQAGKAASRDIQTR